MEELLSEYLIKILGFSWLANMILLPLITNVFKSKNTGWGSFLYIYSAFGLTTGLILIYTILMPEALFSIINDFLGMFSTPA
jgi:hypothetical protein